MAKKHGDRLDCAARFHSMVAESCQHFSLSNCLVIVCKGQPDCLLQNQLHVEYTSIRHLTGQTGWEYSSPFDIPDINTNGYLKQAEDPSRRGPSKGGRGQKKAEIIQRGTIHHQSTLFIVNNIKHRSTQATDAGHFNQISTCYPDAGYLNRMQDI
jgi:hypothetical protein